MHSKDIRQTFLDFFKKRGHVVVPSSSLIPTDPSVLLTTAGMQQFVPYLSGEVQPPYQRACSVQKCFRTGDIDEVGDETHHTFFEMLGNWSFGGYWKKEAIEFALELLTVVYKLPIDRLWATVFKGEEDVAPAFRPDNQESHLKVGATMPDRQNISRDEEAIDLWIKAGIPEERIRGFGMKDNFWGPTSQTGPCGPNSEIHYDRGKEFALKECTIRGCGPNCKCGRFVEVWNLVFMEYNRKIKNEKLKIKNTDLETEAKGAQDEARQVPAYIYEPLPQKNIDTGIGFERLVAILQNKPSAYETDLFLPIIEKLLPISYNQQPASCRIIADHIRGACFLIADGVLPSKEDRGYILRRILRRAMVKMRGHLNEAQSKTQCNFVQLADRAVKTYQDIYPELRKARNDILTIIQNEEEKFNQTLEKGLKVFEKEVEKLKNHQIKKLSGQDAFHFFDTYGFPLELTREMAKEKGLAVDEEGFKEAFQKHQEISRAGLEKKFGGVGIDQVKDQTSKLKCIKLHTATHLLHQALRDVLGKHVKQMGSDINPERLRFDFLHPQKLTDQEKAKVEKIVNQKIKEDSSIKMKEMSYEEALKSGVLAFFREKYPKIVKVYLIGEYSKEICAGPHVGHTGEIGQFKITSEKSSSAGVRRIKAIIF